MKQIVQSSIIALSSLILGATSPAVAGHEIPKAKKDWRWESLAPLFPYTPGMRWNYALSGKQHPNGGQLQVEVKGRQHIPHLKQDVLLFDETHPAAAAGAAAEVVPVLYYPREGYLVRDTAHIYSNPHQTSLLSTGNLGEAVSPVLPLWKQVDGTDWQPVDNEHWAKVADLSISYHVHPETRETVSVKAGTYQDCVMINGTVSRGGGEGYRYQEWYAPNVGMVKSVTADLKTGEVLALKELVSFQPSSPTANT
jgi:hypothetical protein